MIFNITSLPTYYEDQVSLRSISGLICGLAFLLAFALAPVVIHGAAFRLALGDLVPLLVLSVTCFLSLRNAVDSHGHPRLFWSLFTAGMVMWWINQASWTWYEVIVRQPLPDPFSADIVLFLHVVPFIAAVAIRPHDLDDKESMLISTVNIFILLVWWVVVYAFFVFPDEYIVTSVHAYGFRWDMLYLMEGLMLVIASSTACFASSGSWRQLYGGMALASVVYSGASEAINIAYARGAYQSGGPYDIAFLAALLGFLAVVLIGRNSLRETQETPLGASRRRALAPLLAQVALLSLPVMAFVALFLSHDPLYLRRIRFVVAMCGVTILAFFVFLKQYLLDQKLVHLLNHSRDTFENLQRLQGRAVQQAKLASLGELVALAASELEHPLAAILGSSATMAASSNLTREQLTNAQKIGQQARRTRELVDGLLSFAQQTPGEKTPLELKPLLQRAVQMEGFKLENRNINLTVESAEAVPRVLANSNQLLQAFVQIVENAVDALHEVGGGRLQISVWREGDDVVIQFADNGPGLRDPERVFDPFYTTKPVGKGTGLGLSAAYGVVQDHKGQITCFNRPEGGAAFEIRLPGFKPNAAFAELAPA